MTRAHILTRAGNLTFLYIYIEALHKHKKDKNIAKQKRRERHVRAHEETRAQ